MKKILIFVMVCIIAPLTAFAQNSISGTITDSEGNPLPGVSIIVQGQAKGTTSDFDGLYLLTNITSEDVLLFSYVGFETQEVQIEDKESLNVQMAESSVGLEEVVVVGYGTVKKKDLTGAIAKIDAEDLVNTATTNFDQALAGRVSGVQITSVDGTPEKV